MHALLVAVAMSFALAAADALAQGAAAPQCDGVCGVIQSIAPVTERQDVDAARRGGARIGRCVGPGRHVGTTTQMQIGPGFTNQGMVVIGAAGGAVYAQKPNEYRGSDGT